MKTVSSSSELMKSLERLFNNQIGGTDCFTREQYREIFIGVQELTETLGKTQDQLKQLISENQVLKDEIKVRRVKNLLFLHELL